VVNHPRSAKNKSDFISIGSQHDTHQHWVDVVITKVMSISGLVV
jgi:hypothetical protein